MPSLQRASSRSACTTEADSYSYDRAYYENTTSYVDSRESCSSQNEYGTSEYAATGPEGVYVMATTPTGSDEYGGGGRHNSTMSSSSDCHSGTEAGGVSPMHCPTDLRSPQVWPVIHFFCLPCFIYIVKSMTPCQGNAFLFRSFLKFSRLRLGPLKGFCELIQRP